MKRYHYYYQNIVCFDKPVSYHFFKLRCLPCMAQFQSIIKESLIVNPKINMNIGIDSFGNRVQYGQIVESHDKFIYTAEGEINQTSYVIFDKNIPFYYLAETLLTKISNSMVSFVISLKLNRINSIIEKVSLLSHSIFSYMSYCPGFTNDKTPAQEAFNTGCGVCQDYAHILISMCRFCNIPCRYVDGFMLGIGSTHAWVEIYEDNHWYAFDPTNDVRVDYGYIKIAQGRDAADCPVNRGIFRGLAIEDSKVSVCVKEETAGVL